MSNFKSDKDPLREILKKITQGAIQLPIFQRGWIWPDDHVQKIIASVSQSFPIGAILMLENGGPVRLATRRIEGTESGIDTVEPETLILDGQQRLTALFQSLTSDRAVYTLDTKENKTNRWYYLDMKACVTAGTDRVESVISVPENRIVRKFQGKAQLDLSSAEKEYAADMFPVILSEQQRIHASHPICNPCHPITFKLDKTVQEWTMKILLSEAHRWCDASRSKIYNDARDGLISTEKDPHRGNKKTIDTAELERAYGSIRTPDENPSETEKDARGQQIETEKLIESYENRIQDLQKQLALANEREETLTAEKSKLLDLTDRLQKLNETLMLPPPEKRRWLLRLIGA